MRTPDSFIILARALRRRCPQCGRTRLFVRWYRLSEQCSECGLALSASEGLVLGFMYLSTALITGLMIAGMLLIGRPAAVWQARVIVIVIAVALMVGTLPLRKSLAIALEYYVSLRIGERTDLSLRRNESE